MEQGYFEIPVLRMSYNNIESDCEQELRHLLPLAAKWDGDAQYRAGQILAQGLGGVAVDLLEAVKWTDLAARKYHHSAAVALQAMIDHWGWDVVGEGKRRAFRWQQELYNAEDGWPADAPDEFLAFMRADASPGTGLAFGTKLNNRDGGPSDYEKAFRFFRFGAERDGCAECAHRVGNAYYLGKGVKADPIQAHVWLMPIAKNGHAGANLLLGLMAARGHGVARDTTAALHLLQRAEQAGETDAAILIRAINDGVRIY
nr:tetratricopeptide repeat protein [uncultured Dongia sp.]